MRVSSKIPLVYILACDRSGSTLLDILLGSHSELWTVGEAEFLPWELKRDLYPCGCGKRLQRCPFWHPILGDLPADILETLGYFREIHGWWGIFREELTDLLRGKVSERRHPLAQRYGEANAQFFRRVFDRVQTTWKPEIRYLVDASKQPYRLFWLAQRDDFDMWVIHLVKDPRAFVYSLLRRSPHRPLSKAVRFAMRWLIQNKLSERVLQAHVPKDRRFFLRYEDLASRPGEVLSELGKWLGVQFPQDLPLRFRQIENHGVAGNPTRWKDTPIVLDEKWKTHLPKARQWLVWGLTSRLARRYGYTRTEGKKE